jgi:glycosyltransferase involved in cell wall biosynthesis
VINFVSNQPRGLGNGGVSALSAAACAALETRYAVTYVGPIDPVVDPIAKARSRALRACGLGGDFAAFSDSRLRRIAGEVERQARADAALDVYLGFTSWVLTRPPRSYLALGDCTFHDYIGVFHDRRRFRAGDLRRIETAEARWLRAAAHVLFTSDWAAGRATRQYGLDPARVGVVGTFGNVEPPERDAFAGGASFAFVSTDFAAKGGHIVLEALRELGSRHAQARLIIVGAPPTGGLAGPGVEYAGFLRKDVPAELSRLRAILASSVAVVHPTQADISPLLLVEAAQFGCPAIAPRAFAIPELVEHRRTGLLVDAPPTPRAVAAAMAWMLEHPDDYALMRAAAWRRAQATDARARYGAQLLVRVDAALAETRAAA